VGAAGQFPLRKVEHELREVESRMATRVSGREEVGLQAAKSVFAALPVEAGGSTTWAPLRASFNGGRYPMVHYSRLMMTPTGQCGDVGCFPLLAHSVLYRCSVRSEQWRLRCELFQLVPVVPAAPLQVWLRKFLDFRPIFPASSTMADGRLLEDDELCSGNCFVDVQAVSRRDIHVESSRE